MWIIKSAVLSGFIIFIGLIVVVPFKTILDSFLGGIVAELPGLTTFESAIMNFYPVAIFIIIFVAAALVFRKPEDSKS